MTLASFEYQWNKKEVWNLNRNYKSNYVVATSLHWTESSDSIWSVINRGINMENTYFKKQIFPFWHVYVLPYMLPKRLSFKFQWMSFKMTGNTRYGPKLCTFIEQSKNKQPKSLLKVSKHKSSCESALIQCLRKTGCIFAWATISFKYVYKVR